MPLRRRAGTGLTAQFSDLDYRNPEVVEDVCRWGQWIGEQIPLKGMRIDAIRHVRSAAPPASPR